LLQKKKSRHGVLTCLCLLMEAMHRSLCKLRLSFCGSSEKSQLASSQSQGACKPTVNLADIRASISPGRDHSYSGIACARVV
jgi:hypothetical protein